ncbi:MAG: alpha-L-rhamnosidase [Clostridia bacterium]|nr:alpha-L-rhamnosidase [Clostridia bacterium]
MNQQPNFIPAGIRTPEILKKSEQDVRVRRFLTPQRILWKTDGVTGEDCLLTPAEKQIHFNVPRTMCMKCAPAGDDFSPAAVLIDFGVEFHGYVKLYIHSVNPTRVKLRIRFGESAEEAMADLGGKKNATNDHIDRDQIIDVGFLSMPEIGPSGFRFVRIDLLDPGAQITLMAVAGIFVYRELEYKGSFHSNDARLDKIWNTAAYTVHLNMQEYVWDGIKRDRLVWIGDIHPETSTIQAVFGYDKSVENSLDLARNESPLPNMMCGISGYSVWWVLVHYGWYMQNGDLEYLRQQQVYMKELLKFFANCVGEDGGETLPNGRLLDWPTNDNPAGIHAGYQGMLAMCFDAGAFLFGELGDDETVAMCRETAAKLRTHLPDPNGSKQAAAMLILAKIATGEAADELCKMIKKDGAHRISTFFGFYVLQALAELDETGAALDMIRDFWGAMLDRGATTFWEDFNLDWLEGSGRIDELVPDGVKDLHGDYGAYCYIGFRHSLCHGWASGPAAFLSRYVLGITPVEPGCKTVRIAPKLGDLRFVEGTYPTPYGNIHVIHKYNTKGEIVSKIEAPEGVTVIR